MAIVSQLEASVRTNNQAARNVNDAISAAEVAGGAAEQISGLLTRQQELATQAANGTLSDTQRSALNSEFQQLNQEIDRISATTQFNGVKLLNGSSVSVQAGTDSSANSQINLNSISVPSGSGNVLTAENALAALETTKSNLASLSAARGELGAGVSRLEQARTNSLKRSDTEEEAASRIRDADVAEETSKLVRKNIQSKGGASLLAQNNLNAKNVLELLK